MTDLSLSLLDYFVMGGIIMWPLLFFSIATVAITLERFLFLVRNNLQTDDLKIKVSEFICAGKPDEARTYLQELGEKRMGARILLAIINRVPAGNDRDSNTGETITEHRMEKAAEAEAMTCISSLESGLNFLIALGSISPLTGFLGTVTGMIGAFRSISEAEEVSAQIVANGIYEALITTVFGLVIAIIAMVSHSLITNKVDRFTTDVEKTCSDLINEIMDSR